MFVRPTNPITHRLARIAFILAAVGSLIVAVSGPLHRYPGLDIEAAIAVFRYGFYLTVAGDPGLRFLLPLAEPRFAAEIGFPRGTIVPSRSLMSR